MRHELAEVTTEIMRDLGDARGAELVQRAPRSELYKTQVLDDEIRRGKVAMELTEDAANGVRSAVFEAAGFINVVEHRWKLPIGGWPADKRFKEHGGL